MFCPHTIKIILFDGKLGDWPAWLYSGRFKRHRECSECGRREEYKYVNPWIGKAKCKWVKVKV